MAELGKALRKRFWTDVLTSLELSYALLFEAARFWNTRIQEIIPDEYIPDLEERIAALEAHGVSDTHEPLVVKPTYLY